MTKPSALTMNFNEPYGTIHGRLEDRPTAMYEQKGFLYDGAGNVVLTKDEKAEQQKALEAQLASLKASDTTEAPKPVVEEVQPATVEIRDGETGEVDTKTVKDEKSAKAGKGKGGALPSLPE